jgi:RHS repeat-associated protein
MTIVSRKTIERATVGRLWLGITLTILLVTNPKLCAQVGNDNPTGPAGQFNGNITTGCSYDPYTGNATRAITDIVIAGTVGSYPLAFSRVSNSRSSELPAFQFGVAGSWRHSYSWELNATEESTHPNFQPTEYPVFFPDGRTEFFTQSTSFYDPYFRSAPGVRERFIPLNLTTKLAYLVLPDGGKVRFRATPYSYLEPDPGPASTPPPEFESPAMPADGSPNYSTDIVSTGGPGGTVYYGYHYSAEAIIDPYGLETTLTYNSDGSLNTIQEPGGRWIQLHYTAPFSNWEVLIDYVQGSDGRTVKYNYSRAAFPPAATAYTYLGNVVYYPDPSVSSPPTASYTYQAPNAGYVEGVPLLSTADDPMYEGPMKRILYTYATGVNSDNSAVVAGQIRYEKSINGDPVSNLAVVTSGRAETKGDGGFRNFTFNGPRVASWSDFVNFRFAARHYDPTTGFMDEMTDRNGQTTAFASDPLTGNVTSVNYPQTPSDTAPGTPAGAVTFRYLATCSEDPNNCDSANPYYLYSSRDEAGNTTTYHRDVNKRVSQISYPDGGSETFQYNPLGQITYHQLKTGGWESFEYDPNTHLLASSRDPYHDPLNHTGKPTAWYQYNARGWLSSVTDWRGTGPGDANYTTEYDYNLRGQQTLVRHPVDPVATATTRYTIQRTYNPDGTLEIVTDENGHPTYYFYDDYKRLAAVVPPPADASDNTPRITFFYYDRNGGTTLDYTHTDANIGNATTPAGNTVKTFYDANLQKKTVIAGTGSEAGTTTFTYDWAGNLKTVKDPAGQSTGAYTEYFYDERNRLSATNDPISADRNSLGYTVNWMYDAGGRKKSEQRANNQIVSYDIYDAMNRLQQQSVQRDAGVTDVTNYSYDSAGNLQTFRDGRQKSYTYGYDLLSRRTSLTYPPDDGGATRSEIYHFDLANNMDTFTNREGAVQTFEYDNRNRQTHYFWDTWPLYTLHECWMTYDAVGNLARSQTEGMDVSDFVYDWRNRKKSETETWASRPVRTVGYTYDADSNRKSMTYPSGYALTYDYNSRNQLWKESDASGVVVTYGYDISGNRTSRTLRNGTITYYTPDAMNRIKDVGHYRGGTLLGRFDYNFDAVGRIKAVKRDFAKGDYYQYYLDDQLKTAQYDAYNVDLDNPWGAANATTLAYDANGNRTSQSNAATPSYSYGVNDLNEYTAVNSATPAYDAVGNLANYNSWAYGYNRQNQLTDAVNGPTALYFYYDGLNRQILRYVDNQWIYSVWDGWNLIEEYDVYGALLHSYVDGAASDELISRSDATPDSNRVWYYQDAQGSTTHLADDSGNLIESYKYPPADSGAPAVFNGAGQPISASAFDNRFLYTGRDYYRQGSFYDYRHRSYLPSLGRFLQPDPIGFKGDPINRYRYCRNKTVNESDPSGLGSEFGPALPEPYPTPDDLYTGLGIDMLRQLYQYLHAPQPPPQPARPNLGHFEPLPTTWTDPKTGNEYNQNGTPLTSDWVSVAPGLAALFTAYPEGNFTLGGYSQTVPSSGNWIYGGNDAPPGSIIGKINDNYIIQGSPARDSSEPGSTAGFFDPLFGDSPPQIAPGPAGLASGGFGTAFPYARER